VDLNEQPWKRTKLGLHTKLAAPAASQEARREQSFSTNGTLSLRERLLLRIAPDANRLAQVTSPKVKDSPSNAASETESTEIREHKMLGGLSFKWRLLFHEGSKPSKKSESPPSSGNVDSPVAKNSDDANTARVASLSGA
jgi:hypothetical protein